MNNTASRNFATSPTLNKAVSVEGELRAHQSPRKKCLALRKMLLWVGGGVVGLFILITIIGVIGVASQPGGWDDEMQRQEVAEKAQASAEAQEAEAEGEASAALQPTESASDQETKAAPEAAKPEETAAEPCDQCLEVSPELLSAIAEGQSGVPIEPVQGAAVKSEDFDNAYMIAMEFSAPGGNEIGAWTSGSLEPGGGLILSLDGFAKNFTVWPDAMESFEISQADHGVQEAEDCLS